MRAKKTSSPPPTRTNSFHWPPESPTIQLGNNPHLFPSSFTANSIQFDPLTLLTSPPSPHPPFSSLLIHLTLFFKLLLIHSPALNLFLLHPTFLLLILIPASLTVWLLPSLALNGPLSFLRLPQFLLFKTRFHLIHQVLFLMFSRYHPLCLSFPPCHHHPPLPLYHLTFFLLPVIISIYVSYLFFPIITTLVNTSSYIDAIALSTQ